MCQNGIRKHIEGIPGMEEKYMGEKGYQIFLNEWDKNDMGDMTLVICSVVFNRDIYIVDAL